MAELKSLDRSRTPRKRRRRSAPRPPGKPPEPRLEKAGRAWINGSEIGGTDPRYAHLDRTYD